MNVKNCIALYPDAPVPSVRNWFCFSVCAEVKQGGKALRLRLVLIDWKVTVDKSKKVGVRWAERWKIE